MVSIAPSSSVATTSTENGWSLLPALYDPCALNAFMARPRQVPDLTEAGG